MFLNDNRRPSKKAIAEQDEYMLQRQEKFRTAAEWIAADLAQNEDVQRIELIGSVANPLVREVPRFRRFRIHGVECLHECHDVDLAIWLSRLDRLDALRRQLAQSLSRLLQEEGLGIAHHEVDAFLMDAATGTYAGRLCHFGQCPKHKRDCAAERCGELPFLQQIDGFKLRAETFAPGRTVVLFERDAEHG